MATRSRCSSPSSSWGGGGVAISGSTFENVSGKHCTFRLINGVWHVRDMGSTNGTTVNGSRLSSQHVIMPEDEVGIADHLFTIDYIPSGPDAFIATHKVLDHEVQEERKRHSLMELAGLDTDEDRPSASPGPNPRRNSSSGSRPMRAISTTRCPSTSRPRPKPKPKKQDEDDDFLKLIEDEVKKPG